MTLLTSIRLAEIEALCEISSDGQRPYLELLLTGLLSDLPLLSDTITHHYLSHAEPSRHLATGVRQPAASGRQPEDSERASAP
jgi:hypothetical protein